MSKKNTKVVTDNNQTTELDQGALDKPSITSLELLMPAIAVIGDILTETNETYQSLVSKSQTLQSAKETGKSLRALSEQYANVLIVQHWTIPIAILMLTC